MRMLTIFATVLMLFGLCMAGCERGEGPSPEPQEKPPIAYEFHSGVPKFSEGQTKCPVCGQTGIKEELYADVQGNRIYFDKQECLDKFQGSEAEYLQKLRGGMQQQAVEGAPKP